jgi:hypothetical protein
VLPSGPKEVRLCSNCKLTLTPRKYMREFVAVRFANGPTVIHMYKIEELGRRFYRTLVYSSDWRYPYLCTPFSPNVILRYTLHDMPPLVAHETHAQFMDRLASADEEYLQPTLPNESLVIMRNLGTTSQELQTYPTLLNS